MSSFPPLCMGTLNFGTRTPAPEVFRMVDRALERGLFHFDTANLYGDGMAERLLGEALRGRRNEVFLATKVGLSRRGGTPEGLSRRCMAEALEQSLRRLDTDWVDLLYLHAPDPRTPLEETLEAIQGFLERGWIRAWGVSNHAAWQILAVQHAADRRGLPRPAVSQVLYNLLVRQLELEYFAFTRTHGVHTTVYNPLAGGLLARGRTDGGVRLRKNALYRRRYGSPTFERQAGAYAKLAAEAGMTAVQLAYAWVVGRPGVGSVLAGPADVEQLDQAIEGCATVLPEPVRQRVDDLHREWVGTDVSYAR